jgi:K+-sensing histidine kinase KdpD
MARWVVTGLLVLTLLLASLYLLFSVREASRQVRHTDEARVALWKLESVAVDAEAGARGYAASGDKVLLEPYANAVGSRRLAVEAVRDLTMDDAAQQRRLAELEPEIERQFDVLQALIDAHTHGAAGEELVPLLALGKDTMDDIRVRIAEMLRQEDLLDVKGMRSESTKISATFAVLLMAVTLLVAGSIWFAKTRHLEQRIFGRERRAREEAERASKFAELFVAVLGHDLRNPLSAITASASLLANERRDERDQRIAKGILGSSNRMARMIDQILDFSRIRAGQGLIQNPAPMDLREVIGRVREELANGSSIQVEAEGDTEGMWDRDRLAQVFSNLLGNALEHSPVGAPVHVRIDGGRSEDIDVTVQNPGVIPAEVIPELFEPFRQPRQREKPQGLGLGLYISKEIVAAHGGTIEVTSSESAGRSFRVRLPRSPPSRRTVTSASAFDGP